MKKIGDTMTGDLAMSNFKVTGLGTATAAGDATNKTYVDTQDALKVSKAGDTMTGALSMSNQKITNLGTPTVGSDAANKTYADTQDALKVSKAGDTMSGTLNMGSSAISNVLDPVAAQDASTKNYVDTAAALKVSKAGDTMSGNLDMGGNLITNLADPSSAQHAVTLTYANNTYLNAAGDIMTGDLDMNSNKIIGLADATDDGDAVSKLYADNRYVNAAGDAMTGELDMSNQKITTLATPTFSTDATNKSYVDTQDALKVNKSGDTMTGTLNMNSNFISNVPNPVLSGDVVTYGFMLTMGMNFMNKVKDGDTMNGEINMNNNKITNVADATDPQDAVNQQYADARYVNVSGDTMTGQLSMSTQKIINLGTPTLNTDATTKLYTDTADNLRLSKTGGTMSGAIDMGGSQITNAADPTNPQDLVTLSYASSSFVDAAGDTMTGNLDMNNNSITSLADPTNTQDAATKNYTDTQDALRVAKTGDSMTGTLNMSSNTISNVLDPVAAQDASSKNYVDTAAALKVSKAGDTMSGNLDMGTTNNIINLANPTAAQHAATKYFVDAEFDKLVMKDSVRLRTAGALDAYSVVVLPDSYLGLLADSNGTLVIDGQVPTVGQRILVDSNATVNDKDNGIYVVSDIGSPSTQWMLTRSSDFHLPENIESGLFVLVIDGTSGGNVFFFVSSTPVIFDVSPIIFNLFIGIDKFLLREGDSMTGALDMTNNSINNVATPVAGTDAVNKDYVDSMTTNLISSTAIITADPAPAATGTKYLADSSGGVFNFTLPIGSTIGSVIELIDYAGTFATNAVTIVRSGGDTFSFADELPQTSYTAAINNFHVKFHYEGLQKWLAERIYPVTGILPYAVATFNPSPAIANRRYLVNTTGGPFNFTLPLISTVSVGTIIEIVDRAGTFTTNPLTVLTSGADVIYHLSGSLSSSFVLDINNQSCYFTTIDTNRWHLVLNDISFTPTIYRSTNFNAKGGRIYNVDITTSSITVVLPSSATSIIGTFVEIYDGPGIIGSTTNTLNITTSGLDMIYLPTSSNAFSSINMNTKHGRRRFILIQANKWISTMEFDNYSPATITSNPTTTYGNKTYLANTSGGGFTFNLPATATSIVGDIVEIIDIGGTFATNNLTVSGGASSILQTGKLAVTSIVLKNTYEHRIFKRVSSTAWLLLGSSSFSHATITANPSPAVVGTIYHVDTSGAAFIVTLPTSPENGAEIQVIDIKGTFAANNLTLMAGGSDTIEGGASLVIDQNNSIVRLVYDKPNIRWVSDYSISLNSNTLTRAGIELSADFAIPNTGTSKIPFNLLTFETLSGMVSAANNRLIALKAGSYRLTYVLNIFSVETDFVGITIVKNGVTTLKTIAPTGTGPGSVSGDFCSPLSGAFTITLLASDYIEINYNQGTGTKDKGIIIAGSFMEIEELPTTATTLSSFESEYYYATIGGANIPAVGSGVDIKFVGNVQSAGSSISYNQTTGEITLSPNKTYELSALCRFNRFTNASSSLTLSFVDNTNTVLATSASVVDYPMTSTTAASASSVTTAMVRTGGSAAIVKLRVTAATNTATLIGGANNGYLSVKVVDNNTRVSVMTGATGSTAGIRGLVPQPAIGQQGALLLGDGTWSGAATVDKTNGRLGIGTTTPAVSLDVSKASTAAYVQQNISNTSNTASSHARLLLSNGGGSGGDPALSMQLTGTKYWNLYADRTTGNLILGDSATNVHTTSSPRSFITSSSTNWESVSCRAIKKNIRKLNYGLDDVMLLEPILYDLKDDSSKDKIGLVSDDVEEVIPELTCRLSPEILGLSYERLAVVLVQAIKDLNSKVSLLENIV
ncbi:MAG: tail fiber domain-containing protein, partial [Candidatus Riesia sp.]|nr:tail fiber domain-containing protein [Candidatus Riesia sp.]